MTTADSFVCPDWHITHRIATTEKRHCRSRRVRKSIGQQVEELTEILNINGYEMEAKIKHGFGDFEDVVFKRKSS